MATYIGETTNQLVNGEVYNVNVQDFTGKVFKPGKHLVEGEMKWIDTEGTPDIRIALFFGTFYKVYTNVDELLTSWDFSGIPAPRSERIRKRLVELVK